MLVGELISELKKHNPELEVRMLCSYYRNHVWASGDVAVVAHHEKTDPKYVYIESSPTGEP